MSNSKQSDVEKEQFWELVLEEHANSQMSVRAFCRRESLSEPSFYGWRRKLRGKDFPKSTEGFPSGLIPVNVIEEQQQQAAAHAIEIVVPSDVRLKVQEHCSAETMRRVLSVVRETFSC